MKKKCISLIMAIIVSVTMLMPIPVIANDEASDALEITGLLAEYTFTEEAICPEITITDTTESRPLTPEQDYTTEFFDNINCGMAKLVITGINTYEGIVLTETYRITAGDISTAAVELSAGNYSCTGKQIKPAVIVRMGDRKLTAGVDYQLRYGSNKYPGYGYVYVRGIGNYKGEVKKAFAISQVNGCGASITGSVFVKLKWAKQLNITGYKVYRYTAGKYKCIKTLNDRYCTYTVNGLKSKTSYRFAVRAYKKVKGKYYYSPLSSAVDVTTKAIKSKSLQISTASAATVTLKWGKQSGVKKYYIYRSADKAKGYKKIAATYKTSYKNKKLKEGRTYYYKLVCTASDGTRYVSNYVAKVRVKGNYKSSTVYGPYMSSKQRKQVKNAVAKFVNTKIKMGMTSYQKVETAHDYLVNTCQYAPTWRKHSANSAWGALIYKEAQCSGYSRAFKALCDGMGVKCYYVHANSKSVNPSHQWNIVKVGDYYYHIDVQCNDSSGFDAVYLASDSYVKMSGLRWSSSKYPKCPREYFEQ